ncbi:MULTISPECIES: type VI secretion system lipoprotein TssJ [Thalassomonas]|uniref:Type VI secretion system lipoprotein TssJ n=1 Tax=Thalassomonas actiniarum TaxID=485447 RepID=A0AAF0C3P6_9GAMM|nr:MULTISPECIES: type VI secretion system lipoprotein TssJ [Thalassomonas]WDD99160.1 type VI secretion system lipoprotein TssJ [Thalassomonas actiniarum]
MFRKTLSSYVALTFGLLAAVVLTSGCSSMFGSDEPEVVTYPLNIVAGDDINPSDLSPANPVILHLYQLNNLEPFQSAEVIDLYQQDATLLADSLVHKTSLASVLPKENRKLDVNILPGTKYLAVFAEFASYGQAKTRAWVDVSNLEDDDIEGFTVAINLLTLNIQAIEDSGWW